MRVRFPRATVSLVAPSQKHQGALRELDVKLKRTEARLAAAVAESEKRRAEAEELRQVADAVEESEGSSLCRPTRSHQNIGKP